MMIEMLAEIVTKPFVFFPILFLQGIAVAFLCWMIWHKEDVIEYEKWLFGNKTKKTRQSESVDYDKLCDDIDVAKMMKTVEEAWK